MSSDRQNIREELAKALGITSSRDDWDGGILASRFFEFLSDLEIDKGLYTPDSRLASCINDVEEWFEKWDKSDSKTRRKLRKSGEFQRVGKLMESIALLTFKGVIGFDSLKSYTSYSQQHDLVISGNNPAWVAFLQAIGLSKQIVSSANTILVEAKNTESKVNDAQFTRLCYIAQNKFTDSCWLGIFFTYSGAAGFPLRDGKRIRSLSDAWATQIIFHAKTGKYIIVLDIVDIRKLNEPGAFPSILRTKIRDVEHAPGRITPNDADTDGNLIEIDLPSYLSALID